MAGLFSMFRKTIRKGLRKGTSAVRFVGKKTTNVLKKGTNAVGLTKRGRKSRKASRKSRKSRK